MRMPVIKRRRSRKLMIVRPVCKVDGWSCMAGKMMDVAVFKRRRPLIRMNVSDCIFSGRCRSLNGMGMAKVYRCSCRIMVRMGSTVRPFDFLNIMFMHRALSLQTSSFMMYEWKLSSIPKNEPFNGILPFTAGFFCFGFSVWYS